MKAFSIVEVVEQYVSLKKSGREFVGLCPFHSEKTPSFTVNEEKGVWYCFSCCEGGDAITFIEKVEGVGFKDAIAHLGIEGIPRTFRSRKSPERQAAEAISVWAEQMSSLIGERMRAIGQRGYLATTALSVEGVDKDFLREEKKNCARKWAILEALDDDLVNPQLLPELWKQHNAVEAIVNG